MSRLIDADALLKRNCGNLVDGIYYTSCEECQADGEVCGLEIDAEEIRNAPTVDAVKHGHWVFNGKPIEKWSHGNYCSVCGEYSETCGNYCPYCGAEMDEMEDE